MVMTKKAKTQSAVGHEVVFPRTNSLSEGGGEEGRRGFKKARAGRFGVKKRRGNEAITIGVAMTFSKQGTGGLGTGNCR